MDVFLRSFFSYTCTSSSSNIKKLLVCWSERLVSLFAINHFEKIITVFIRCLHIVLSSAIFHLILCKDLFSYDILINLDELIR